MLALVLLVAILAVPVSPGGAGTVDDEAAFVSMINSLRQSRGLNRLTVSGELTAQARHWSAVMARDDKLEHAGDLSVGVTTTWDVLGENVGVHTIHDLDALFRAFVASPAHLDNLLDPRFDEVGVGVAHDDSGKIWTTHRFMSVTTPVSAPTAALTTPAPTPPPTQAPPPAPAPAPAPTPPPTQAPAPAPTQAPAPLPATSVPAGKSSSAALAASDPVPAMRLGPAPAPTPDPTPSPVTRAAGGMDDRPGPGVPMGLTDLLALSEPPVVSRPESRLDRDLITLILAELIGTGI